MHEKESGGQDRLKSLVGHLLQIGLRLNFHLLLLSLLVSERRQKLLLMFLGDSQSVLSDSLGIPTDSLEPVLVEGGFWSSLAISLQENCSVNNLCNVLFVISPLGLLNFL